MIPLRDSIPSSRPPVVNWVLMALCLVTFLMQLGESEGSGGRLTEQLAMIPARVAHPDRPVLIEDVAVEYRFGVPQQVRVRRPAEAPPFPAWLTLLTCIFLHGGWMHFLGNMLFLWIFGDNVEDRLGRLGYLLFYLGCGVGASLAHFLTDPSSPVPTVGASGAIAGVMGAYLLLYPHSKVEALLPLGFILQMVVVPAPVFLGIWFLLQLFQGTMTLGNVEGGGVAFWAHIGGFAIGFVVVAVLRGAGRLRPPPPSLELGPRRIQYRVMR